MLMLFANFPVSCCRAQQPAFSYAATAFSLACAIFLQDLDPCLAYKASSGYLLSFVFNISNEKRQEVKELIDVTQSLHLSYHVPQIHPRGYFCLALARFFIFFLTSIQCFRFGFL